MEKLAVIDVETTGLDFIKDKILGIGIWVEQGGKYFTDLPKAKAAIDSLRNKSYQFSAHNQKFDWKVLHKNGLIDETFVFHFDPKLASPLLEDRPGSNGLEAMASFYNKTFPWKDAVAHKNIKLENQEVVADYCLKDCEETYKLTETVLAKLKEEGQLEFYSNYIMPLDAILTRASYLGIGVSQDEIQKQLSEYREKTRLKAIEIREKYKDKFETFEILQINKKLSKFKSDKGREKAKLKINNEEITLKILNSPKQLLVLYQQYFGVELRDREGKPGVGEDALFLASHHPEVMDLIHFKELNAPERFFNQWAECSESDGKIHPNFNIDIARTGRLSCSEPNLQNIPTRADKAIRRCFVPDTGKLLIARDLSQIEPRFIAHYSQDPKLLMVYNEGLSLYGQVAIELGLWKGLANELKAADPITYSIAKTIVLAILYNMGSRKLAFDLKKDAGVTYTTKDCRDFIRLFFTQFSGISRLREQASKRAVDRGYLINYFGRKVFVPREQAEMVAMNTLIQGSASDFMAFLQLYQQKEVKELGADLLLLIHDEEIYQAPISTAHTVDKLLEAKASEFGKLKGLRVPIITEGGVFKNLAKEE